LNVSQRGTGIVDQPGGSGDECPAARMGRRYDKLIESFAAFVLLA
jgi:hypothetical protein